MSNNLFDFPDAIVYMIQYSNEPIYKIGYTTDMNTRLRRIAILVPHSVDLIHTIYTDDPRWLETYWHNRFAAQRRPGSGIRRSSEWFNLTKTDVQEFKSHTVIKRPPQEVQPEVSIFAEENPREVAIRKVIRHYNDLIRQHPHRAVKLANSCNHQIEAFNTEISRMQSSMSHVSVERAIEMWEQRAYSAAQKKL